PSSRVRGEAAEQFGGRQSDEIRRGKTKSAGECAEDKIDILQRVGSDQFAKALDFTLGLKINNNAGFIFPPFAQSLDELVALRFREQKIAHGKFTDVAILKCAAEIFGTGFNPALADLSNLTV